MNVDDSLPNTSNGTGGGPVPSQPPMYTAIGRYKILRELGRGAMGVVMEAVDPKIGRKVALKVLHDVPGISAQDLDEFKSRFFREARTAGMLSHPNIVVIHDVDSDEKLGISFMAMEYLRGQTVYDLLKSGVKFTTEQAIDICIQVAEGLDHAHRQGIVHRDVKPANLMLLEDGTVKITDFGIAKISTSNLTRTGQFLGTPNYMSPEQVIGHVIDGRSDLFSLGIILYELLTGEKPFMGSSLTTITYQIVNVDPIEPSKIRPGLPKKYDAIAQKLLRKAPDERFQTGKEVAEALRQVRDGVADAAKTTVGDATRVSAFNDGAGQQTANTAAPPPAQRASGTSGGPSKITLAIVGIISVAAVAVAALLVMREPEGPAAGTSVAVAGPGPTLPSAPPVSTGPPGPTAVVGTGPAPIASPTAPGPTTFVVGKSGPAPAPTAGGPTAAPRAKGPGGATASRGGTYDRRGILLPGGPTGTASSATAPVAAPAQLATLNIVLSHKLKDGTFRVLVDGQERLSESLTPTGKRKGGSFTGEIKLADGKHTFKACVESPEIKDGQVCAQTMATIAMNSTKTLRVEHGKPPVGGSHYITVKAE